MPYFDNTLIPSRVSIKRNICSRCEVMPPAVEEKDEIESIEQANIQTHISVFRLINIKTRHSKNGKSV